MDADTAALKVKHAQEVLDLAGLHAGQRIAAVASSKSVRDALEVRQRAERVELADQHGDELTAQGVLRKSVADDGGAAVAALEAQHQFDREAAEASYRQAKDTLTTLRNATAADGVARTKLMDESHAVAVQALKNTYAAAITGLSRGRAGVQDGWTARLVRLADDEGKALAALAVAADLEIKRIADIFGQRAKTAERLLTADRRAAKRAASWRVAASNDRRRPPCCEPGWT